MKLTTNDLEFIKFVKRECRRTKIKCIFKKNQYEDDFKSS